MLAQAVGFRTGRTLLMPLAGMEGIRPGAEVVATGRALMAPVGDGLLGRVLDGLGRPIDGLGPLPLGRAPRAGRRQAAEPARAARRSRSGSPSACARSTP